MSSASSRIPGFYRLGVAERRARLADLCKLSKERLAQLDTGGISVQVADGMIENVIGTHALPLGIALNFMIDDADYVVPMAIEEPSVVAAASNAAKMARQGGGFQTDISPPIMIGQVQLTKVADPIAATAAINASKETVLDHARSLAPRMLARGGGPVDLEVHQLAEDMLVVHLLVDCRDAMGANVVNSMAEGIADEVAALANASVGLRILSNLTDKRLAKVTATVPADALDPSNGASVCNAIVAASRFAEVDPYRATTHNKGIMNGVDAVLLATGNDWRGVEAGAHAYACRTGTYRPLATWSEQDGNLVGSLEIPMAVGTVGGALHVHEGAKLSLELMGIDSAERLAAVVAAAGLATNLAALRALATDGIQRGHMSLHARVVARAAGAKGDMIERVAAEISRANDVKLDRARDVLSKLREEAKESDQT